MKSHQITYSAFMHSSFHFFFLHNLGLSFIFLLSFMYFLYGYSFFLFFSFILLVNVIPFYLLDKSLVFTFIYIDSFLLSYTFMNFSCIAFSHSFMYSSFISFFYLPYTLFYLF